jgi:hypothetical protein
VWVREVRARADAGIEHAGTEEALADNPIIRSMNTVRGFSSSLMGLMKPLCFKIVLGFLYY